MAIPSSKTSMQLLIVSPDQVIYEDQAVRVIAPGIDQDIALLPDHTPLYAQLKNGDILITQSDGSLKTIPIESGIVRVKSNRVSIITGF